MNNLNFTQSKIIKFGKEFALLLLVFLSLNTPIIAQRDFILNTTNRTYTSLNGKWEYVLDPYETGQIGFMQVYKNVKPKNKTERVEYNFENAQTLWVPGSWNFQKPELMYYEGTIWYHKAFDKIDLSSTKRYFIYVGAANYNSTVTLNGQVIGKHEGGFTPFSFEITNLIHEKDNFVIIGVNNSRAANQIPAKVTDWFNHGGITRDIKLIEVPSTFINNYFFDLEKSSLHSKTKTINGKLQLSGEVFPSTVLVKIPALNVAQEVSVRKDGTSQFTLKVKNLKLWSPNSPTLYDIVLEAGEDVVKDQIGFRTIETKGKQILLNGKPIFLKGISLHDENPLRKDRANSPEDAALMLGWAKELGCNFIRLAHYPHQENIVRMADQMGILLWEELPVYWGIDWEDPEVLEKAKNQYTELINRDYNRASSIIWSIANETSGEPRNTFLISLANYIRTIDSTRLLSAACKKDQAKDGHPDDAYTLNDPIMKYLDIISFNEYLGWYGGLPAESRKKTFTSDIDKPIIVSEFGGGALQGFHGDSLTRWSEEYQAYLYKESIAMFDKIDGLAGMTPWILADFLSPLRQLPNIQDGWNRKGLISEKGYKKKAFFILQNYYKSK